MSELDKAAVVRAPVDNAAVPNDFQVRYFTVPTTHAADALPKGWYGQWVEMYVVGGAAGTDAMYYGFSKASNAEVDRTVAATAAGASDKVGGVVPTGETRQVKLPRPSLDGQATAEQLYFVREGSVALTCYMRLAS